MRMLADGKRKATLLTTKPDEPGAPTATELNGGIDISWDVLWDDFTWTAAASDTITNQKPLAQKGNTTTFGASNYDLGLTLFRKFGVGATEEAWDALSTKGNRVWIYVRESEKDADDQWAASDPIYLGGEVQTDTPQYLDGTGFIRRRILLGAQSMYDDIQVGS